MNMQLLNIIVVSDDFISVNHYLPWKGQLQVGAELYNVALRSARGALVPAKL